MKTAKEWVQEHQATRDTEQLRLCDVVESDIISLQIEVMEEAAVSQCYWCRQGGQLDEDGMHDFGHRCDSSAIHDMIDALRKELGTSGG